MVDAWYYGHDQNKIGPFSQQQMKDLASSGQLGPSDTVWKEGVEIGVTANRVKNLFARLPAPQAPAAVPLSHNTAVAAEPALVPPPSDELPSPVVEPAAPTPQEHIVRTAAVPKKKKPGVATALNGADIVNQDGTQARYRMKCTECGQKDSATHVAPLIMSKSLKVGFYCRKCKRRREAVIKIQAG